MHNQAFRLYINGKEITSTCRYQPKFICKHIAASKRTCTVRVDLYDKKTKEVDKTLIGRYKTVGNLRPVLYHLGGDNPLNAPQPVAHKFYQLRPLVGRKMKTGGKLEDMQTHEDNCDT